MSYYLETKKLGKKGTQEAINLLVSLGNRRVDGVKGLHTESRMEFEFDEFPLIGITRGGQVMFFDKRDDFGLKCNKKITLDQLRGIAAEAVL